MKYLYNRGIGKQTSRKWVILPVSILVLGLYGGFNVLAPIIYSIAQPTNRIARTLQTQQPDQNTDRLYIPKINISIDIAPIGTYEVTGLNIGAVSRSNQNGNPKSGGNYVLVAEQFSLQVLPSNTFERSPFYNLKNIQPGDDLFVDYKGTRFVYKLDTREIKDSTDPSIEGNTKQPRLTLYTTELTNDGRREVFTATQLGKVVWSSGKPVVESIFN